MDEEKPVWKSSSSAVINLDIYSICGFLALLFLFLGFVLWGWLAVLALAPLGYAGFRWFENRCRVYELTTQRLRISSGVFTRRTDDLELYRVKDTTLVEPLSRRLFGLGDVVLTTNDASTPTVAIEAIPKAGAFREELRKHVETCREQKKVRLAELE